MKKVITLTTDFGLRDPYVSTMKAVIHRINPDVTIIDVSHDVDSFNVREGSYSMYYGLEYYPPGSIHVGVVHPEVGEKNYKGIIVETEDSTFVAPNNGLLTIPLKEEKEPKKAYQIEEDRIPKIFHFIKRLSRTFWARDVFAPVAASLSLDKDPEEFGSELSLEEIKYFNYEKSKLENNYATGSVMNVDKYGNVLTNIHEDYVNKLFSLDDKFNVKTEKGEYTARLVENYSQGKENELIGVINELWRLELAMNCGSASKILKTKIGDKLTVSKL